MALPLLVVSNRALNRAFAFFKLANHGLCFYIFVLSKHHLYGKMWASVGFELGVEGKHAADHNHGPCC